MNAHGTANVTTEAQTCKMLVMTSALNHEDTKKFFDLNKYFRANSESIVFFQ
jgi:UDP-N-acetylglucosamine pyrophosphorylase